MNLHQKYTIHYKGGGLPGVSFFIKYDIYKFIKCFYILKKVFFKTYINSKIFDKIIIIFFKNNTYK